MFSKTDEKMNTYLLDNDFSYKILILYILKNIDNDTKRIIYKKLVNFEIIEIMNQNWTELIISDEINQVGGWSVSQLSFS